MSALHEPLRVLRVLPTLEVGGTEVQCVEVLDELAAHREALKLDVELITLFQGQHRVAERRQGAWSWRPLDAERSAVGALRVRGQLAAALAASHYDVVHAMLWPAIWVAASSQLGARRAPLIGSIHSSAWPNSGTRHESVLSVTTARAALRRAGHLAAGGRLSALVFNSLTGRMALAGEFGWREHDAVVIPNGKSIETREPQVTGRTGVLCAARVVPSKRQDLLVAALASVPSLRADFVGEGTEAAAFLEGLRPLGARARGHGAVADVGERLQRCAIAALPTDHEGLPNAVVEAWCQGAAVIASRVPGVEHFVDDNVDGLLVDNTVDGWTRGLARLAADDELRGRLARSGYARAIRDHSLHVTAKRWADLYRAVARGATDESWPPRGRSRWSP